jgi:hypothetical protein
MAAQTCVAFIDIAGHLGMVVVGLRLLVLVAEDAFEGREVAGCCVAVFAHAPSLSMAT